MVLLGNCICNYKVFIFFMESFVIVIRNWNICVVLVYVDLFFILFKIVILDFFDFILGGLVSIFSRISFY